MMFVRRLTGVLFLVCRVGTVVVQRRVRRDAPPQQAAASEMFFLNVFDFGRQSPGVKVGPEFSVIMAGTFIAVVIVLHIIGKLFR